MRAAGQESDHTSPSVYLGGSNAAMHTAGMIVMGTVGYDNYTTAFARRNKEIDGED